MVKHANNAMLNAYIPMSNHHLHQSKFRIKLFAVSFDSTYDRLNDN